MDSSSLLAVIRAVLEQPTAPFHEDAVRGEIERQLADLPQVTVERDSFGNVIALYRNGPAAPRFAFAAHMDHPAYVGGEFLGGVPESYRAAQPPTRDFGPFAMWDLPAFEVRERRIHSRACDDLIGCAAIVATLRALAESGAEAACYGLFTRAEEVGFIGAIHLAQSALIPKDVAIVSLETSSEQGGPGRMGGGVIIRVGDRTSIFDSDATALLQEVAQRAQIPYQRCLMSGGTCEATAYQLYGYRAAGLCVALGNYHNCAPENRLEPEFVSISDVEAMTDLCLAAASARDLPDPSAKLRAQCEERVLRYARYA